MAVRVKRRRRLIIVLVVTVGILTVLGGGFFLRMNQIRTNALDARVQGMAAFESEDYYTAMHKLGTYLNHFPDDHEVMYSYAHARLHNPVDGGQHVGQAIGMLRRLVELNPEYPDARSDLLELYMAAGLRAEVKNLADDMIEVDPNNDKAIHAKFIAMVGLREYDDAIQFADEVLKTDPAGEYIYNEEVREHALRTKVVILNKDGKIEDALRYAKQYNDLAPEDIESQFNTLQLMQQLGASPTEYIERVREIQKNQGDDHRYVLLEAMAYRLGRNQKKAIELLREVADTVPTEELLVRRLIGEMDNLGLYSEATEALVSASEQIKNLWLQRVLVHRMIQAGMQEEVLKFLDQAEVDPKAPDSDSELLGLYAMALLEAERHPEAGVILEVLSERTHDTFAEGWVPFLRDVKAQDNPDISEVVEICQKSIAASPNNPYYHYVLAQGYANLGEIELAMNAWGKAAEYGQPWAAPRMQIAKALLKTDRKDMAVAVAESAFRRAPRHPEVAITLAMAVANNIDQLPDDRLDALMTIIERIQAVLPNDLRARQVEILTLVRRGDREAARQAFMNVLDSDEFEMSELEMRQFTELSRKTGLGLEKYCMVKAKDKYGLTPSIALQHALEKIRESKSEQGLEEFRQAMVGASAGSKTEWDITLAQLLEVVGDGASLSTWASLGDDNQDNVRIQKAILTSRVAWADMDLIDRTIDRLRALTRDEAITWRVARARWIMNQADGDEKELAEAIEMLNEVVAEAPALVEPRLVLAYCYQQSNNFTGAIEQLSRASEIQPTNHSIKLDLARILQSQNNYDRVRVVVKQIIDSDTKQPNHISQVAELLVRQGDVDRALVLLEQIYDPGGKPQNSDLLLARIYVQKNRDEDAEQVVQKLLADPTPGAVRFAANYYASRGRHDEAENALTLLADIRLAPGMASVIRGEYYSKYADSKRGVQEYELAIKSAPKNLSIWKELIRLHIVRQDAEQAISAGKRAIDALGEDSRISWFMQHSELIQQSIDDKRPVGLILGILGNDETRNAAVECLQVLSDVRLDPSTTDQAVTKLIRLANTNTQFLDLQLYITKLMTSLGRIEDAVLLGTRAMEAFPTNPVPAKLSATALASAGRWDEVVGVAMSWRERTGRNTLDADLMIAEAKLRLSDPEGALRQIHGYIKDKNRISEKYNPVHLAFVRSLLMLGHVDKVEKLLSPVLTEKGWRETWVRLAVTGVSDSDVAQEWLSRVPGMLSEDAHDEWTLLIRSWIALAEKYKHPEFHQRAKKLSNEAVKFDGAPSELWLLNGIVEYEVGDLNAAVASYRKSLELNPSPHSTKNNLAMALADQGSSLDEALRLSQEAVGAAPNIAAYYDTLATVYSARGEYDMAIENIERAIQLEPGNPLWSKNLAAIRTKAGIGE